jgi:hypothetical protein
MENSIVISTNFYCINYDDDDDDDYDDNTDDDSHDDNNNNIFKHNCFEVPVENENYCKIVNERGDLAVITTVGRVCHQIYEKTKQCWIDSTLIKLKGNMDFFNREKKKYYEMNPKEKLAETGDPYLNGYNREMNDDHFVKSQINHIQNLQFNSLNDFCITFIPKGEEFFITATDVDYGDETIHLKSKIEWLSA